MMIQEVIVPQSFQHDTFNFFAKAQSRSSVGSGKMTLEGLGSKPSGRIYLTKENRARLMKEFNSDRNPSRLHRNALSVELNVPVRKIDMWYATMRTKCKYSKQKELILKQNILSDSNDVDSDPIPLTSYAISANIPIDVSTSKPSDSIEDNYETKANGPLRSPMEDHQKDTAIDDLRSTVELNNFDAI